jgi:hypothetical protein
MLLIITIITIVICIIIIYSNIYIINFVIHNLINQPYPYNIYKEAIKNGLSTTFKKYIIEQGGYAIIRFPLENTYDMITNEKIPIEQYDKFKKKNSVPKAILEIALITDKGTSIFLENYEDRGIENQSKIEYMSALTFTQLELYKKIIIEVLQRNNLSIFNRIMIITWLLHFGIEPNNNDIEYMILFSKSLSNMSDLLTRQKYINRKKEFFNLLKKNINNSKNNSICGIWTQRKYFSIENIAVEISHNILAMTIQWTKLSKKILENPEELNDIDTFLNKNAFAPFIASKINNNRRITQVLGTSNDKISYISSTMKKKCPFNNDLYVTNTNEIVPNGYTINVNPLFNAFGSNYRRCPGEILTRIYISEFIKILPSESDNNWPTKGTFWGLDKI